MCSCLEMSSVLQSKTWPFSFQDFGGKEFDFILHCVFFFGITENVNESVCLY